MKQGLTEIVIILDMTGSMQLLASETVINLNRFIEEQKQVPGEANLTLITFNSLGTVRVYDHADLHSINPMKASDYQPDGLTPLLDTIGNMVKDTGEWLKNMPEEDRPEKMLVAIITDGEENFSRKYNRKTVFDMVRHQQDVYKWKFLFFGANQDSYLEAGRLGVPKQDIQNYQATPRGIRTAYQSFSYAAAKYRTG